MKMWNDVELELNGWLADGLKGPVAVVNLANACIGYPYVFGSWGERCTPSNRKSRARSDHPTIESKCQVLNGSKSGCSGCKWYPGGTTLSFDCRGFTYFCLLKGAGIKLVGAGATSQYDNNANWSEKGPIAKMPKDKVCCVFRHDNLTGKKEHTLLYDGHGNYIHCSGEVKKCAISKYKATHYAIPKGLYDGDAVAEPISTYEPNKGTAAVTGKNVALREGPSTSNKIIMRIPTDTIVDVATETNEWQLIVHDGRTGYMMKQFIAQDPAGGTAVVTGKNVALREGPGTNYKIIKRIPTKTTVGIARATDEWQLISYKGKIGYMMRKFIKESNQ